MARVHRRENLGVWADTAVRRKCQLTGQLLVCWPRQTCLRRIRSHGQRSTGRTQPNPGHGARAASNLWADTKILKVVVRVRDSTLAVLGGGDESDGSRATTTARIAQRVLRVGAACGVHGGMEGTVPPTWSERLPCRGRGRLLSRRAIGRFVGGARFQLTAHAGGAVLQIAVTSGICH